MSRSHLAFKHAVLESGAVMKIKLIKRNLCIEILYMFDGCVIYKGLGYDCGSQVKGSAAQLSEPTGQDTPGLFWSGSASHLL